MGRWLKLFLFFSASLSALETKEEFNQAIRDWRALKDFPTCKSVALEAHQKFPEELLFHKHYILALAKTRELGKMCSEWDKLYKKDEKKALESETLEEMAWSIIEEASLSTTPLVRLISIIASAISQDINGVKLLKKELHSKNSLLRAVALDLTTKMGDETFKEDIIKLFRTETVAQVKIKAIIAAGVLRITELKKEISALIDSPSTAIEEKEAAIQSLVSMQRDISPFELDCLLKGVKESHKLIGCELCLQANFAIDINLLIPLLQDRSSSVRLQALRSIGLLFYQDKSEALLEISTKALDDMNPKVQATALWLKTLVIKNTKEVSNLWMHYLMHQDQETRLFSAALIGTLGSRAEDILLKGFKKAIDPYVKWNLSIALLEQRVHVEEATKVLSQALNESSHLMWKERAGLHFLSPSTLKTVNAEEAMTPANAHLLCQLKILSILSLFDSDLAYESLKTFLKNQNWEVFGSAASLLLTEGPTEAVDLVKELINDDKFPFKIEAYILLAAWGKEPGSGQPLVELYPKADRKKKEAILEALGNVGDKTLLPFLVERLQEPYPILRVIAASSILGILNR